MRSRYPPVTEPQVAQANMPRRHQIVVISEARCHQLTTPRVRPGRCKPAPRPAGAARSAPPPSISQMTGPSSPPTARRARPAGSMYRGGPGMWSWVAHRITGLLTFFFLFAHVLDSALVRVSPESYDRVIDLYKNPVANVLEVGLVGAVLFHALNGLRIIAVDFWSKGARHQRQLLWVVVFVWVVVMVPATFVMLQHAAGQVFGSK
jgi:succinate dehydrogenase / fumarate reductase cytochrome b subunit